MRPRSIAGIAVGGALAVLMAAYGAALLVDLGRYKPEIADAARDATGRNLTVGGELRLVALRPALVLEDVTLSNASWAAEPSMFRASRVVVAVKFLPLLSGKIELAQVEISGAEVFLETDTDGTPNWHFHPGSEEEAKATPDAKAAAFPRVTFVRDAVVSFRGGRTGGDAIRIDVSRAEVRNPGSGQRLTAEAELEFRGEEGAAKLDLPPVLDLIANRPGSIRLEATLGGAVLSADGSVEDFRSGRGLDVAFHAKGGDASRLAKLADLDLPISVPFGVSAQLSEEDGTYRLSGVLAELDGNEVSGEASFDRAASPRRAAASFEFDGDVTGKMSLAARGDTPFELLGNLAGTFEVVRAGEFALSGRIGPDAGTTAAAVIEVGGSVRGQAVSLRAIVGPLQALDTTEPIAFDVVVDAPETRLAVKGLARDLLGERRVSAMFEFDSGDLGVLAQVFGVEAPAPGARAAGNLEGAGSRLILTGLEAEVGGSDLRGDVTLEWDGRRTNVIAALASRRLDSADFVLADDEPTAVAEAGSGAVLSDDPLPFDALGRVDAEVIFQAAEVFANGIELGRVSSNLTLKDGDLILTGLSAEPFGVPLNGRLSLSTSGETPALELELSGRQADLTSAMQEGGIQVASASVESIDIKMSASGGSESALAESLRGDAAISGLSLRSASETNGDLALDLRLALRGSGEDIVLNGGGTLSGQVLSVAGVLPSVNSLRRGADLDSSFEVRAGESFLVLVSAPQGGGVTEFTLDGQGPLLRDLSAFAGLNLADTGPHALAGVVRVGPERFEMQGLKFVSGETNLTAEGVLGRGSRQKSFDLQISSTFFDIDDLIAAPAEVEGTEQPTADRPAAPGDGTPLPVELLRDFGGAIAVQFGEVHLRAVKFSGLTMAATLNDETLDITEFTVHVGGAPVSGRILVAAQGEMAALQLSFAGAGIDPALALTDPRLAASFTTAIDTEVNLEGQGATYGDLISSLNGRVQVIAGEGRFEENKYLFFETGILRQLAPWEKRRETTNLNCFVADFVVENGVARANGLLFDTEFMSVLGKGEIGLGDRSLGLTFSPRPKEARLLDLAIPVRLGGTFDKPTFLPTPGGVTKKVATTLGALVNPLVLIVPVIQSATNDKNPCVEALANAAADPGAAKKDEGTVGGVLKGLGRTLRRLGGEE